APTEAQISDAIEQLGSDDAKVRDDASEFLWLAGKPAERALQQAATGDDPEIVSRARAILNNFKGGVFPNVPPALSELIVNYESKTIQERERAFAWLAGMSRRGQLILFGLAVRQESLPARQQVIEALARRFPNAAGAALAAG